MTEAENPAPESPPTVAIIGASNDRRKFGNKCVRAYLRAGYQVFPVNLSEPVIEGLTAYPAIGEVPADLDRIALYLPPPLTRSLLPEIAAKGASDGVYFNPGTSTPEVLREAEEMGIPVRDACAIVALGMSPSQFPA